MSGDHTVAVYLYCGQEVRRGNVGSPKKEFGNRGMQQHVERIHKDSAAGLQEARARLAAEAFRGNMILREMEIIKIR